MSEVKKVYGIDLGTTYSCISYMDEHYKAVVIKNAEGESITPSVVFFEDIGEDKPNIIVGSVAKESAKLFPSDVAAFIKRQMGTGNPFHRGNESYSPEEISSYILRKLVQDAESSLDEKIENVVITVPAYFGVNEREATKRAGEIAGLNVVGLIPEPTAAAIAYGMTKENNKKVLVYDLGGGTFDVTLINISPESVEVIVTGGDHNLGGKDWDDTVIHYLTEQFKEKTGNEEDILDDEETAQLLQLEAEKAKKTLSSRKNAPISVIHGSEKARIELSREKFEEITEHLLERTVELTKQMLEEAKKKGEGKDQIDEIILVGGSTRMPQVVARLIKEFNVAINVFDPDESVAKGAALYGMQKSIQDWVKTKVDESNKMGVDPKKSLEEALNDVQVLLPGIGGPAKVEKWVNTKIINVTSKSFGIVAIIGDSKKVVNLIKKNDRLPAVIPRTFGTLEANQDAVLLEVMENEVSDDRLEIENAVSIGEAVLELPTGLPEGSPIEVTFVLNEDGRLDVTGREVTDNRIVEASIQTTNVITKEEVEEAKERSKALQVS